MCNFIQIPFPPDSEKYIGNYTCPQLINTSVNIYSKEHVLFADFSFTVGSSNYFYTASLKYYDDLKLQIYFISSQSDCLFEEALALNNAWMYFDEGDKVSPGFVFPILQCHMMRVTK